MARSTSVLIAVICWFPNISRSQNGCSVTNICDSTHSECRTSENAALGKMAEISTLLMNSSFGDSAPACVVVNGNRSNWFSGRGNADNCAHTNETDYTGWWQVHLGRNYTIQNISIYSQNTGDRLSEVRITIDGQVCYDFPSIITGVSIINVTCNTPLTGSTVRLEKRKRAATNTYYLVLCEVEIWVCRPGLYGQSCDNKCNCKNNDTCNNYYGTCPNGCDDGYYTANCKQKCGRCLDVKCHIVTGQCMSGCQSGSTGQFCTESCPDYYYGPNCNNKCGHCLRNGTCNTTTGECLQGCDPGWISIFCNQSSGLCESTNVSCDPVIGTCPFGCQVGYQPPLCDKTCPNNTYGKNCSQTCEHCASFPCDPFTGHCDQCQGNFAPPFCDASKDVVPIIVGVIVPLIVALAVGVFFILWLRHRRKRKTTSGHCPQVKMQDITQETSEPSGNQMAIKDTSDVGISIHSYDKLQFGTAEKSIYSVPTFRENGSDAQEDSCYYNM